MYAFALFCYQGTFAQYVIPEAWVKLDVDCNERGGVRNQKKKRWELLIEVGGTSSRCDSQMDLACPPAEFRFSLSCEYMDYISLQEDWINRLHSIAAYPSLLNKHKMIWPRRAFQDLPGSQKQLWLALKRALPDSATSTLCVSKS